MRKITGRRAIEYVMSPNKCPVCKSKMIEGGGVDVKGTTATQVVFCKNCELEWEDTYTLTSIRGLG